MRSFPEARPFLPIDLPLVRRLTPIGVSFDSETSLTRGVHIAEGAVWATVPLTDLGTPTFVLRDGECDYIAQFRHKAGEQHAHITFIAPDIEIQEGENAWLRLLDTMVVAAGRRGALTLNAEVDESGAAFAVLRQAGFAVYARQEIWKREPKPVLVDNSHDILRTEIDLDAFGINNLYAGVVPRLVLQADAPPEIGHGGMVYECDDQILAYLSVQEGKCGIYVESFLHPEAYEQTEAILTSALCRLPRADRVPVYFCVRRYQDWLRGSLSELGFEAWASQAVMVKHTASRIEQTIVRPIYSLEGVIHALPPVIDYDGCRGVKSSLIRESGNGVSHHRRSGKAESSPPRVPGRLA